MRIVGLSGGRRSGNNELMLKTALAAAKQVCGAELEIIRLQDLKLRDCIGCETCMRGLTTGGDGLCVVRDDDMPWFSAAVKEADALILATPIYDLIPTGTVVTLLNRVLGIGKEYQTYCRTHPKIGAAMALGGSDWINLTEPLPAGECIEIYGVVRDDGSIDIGHNVQATVAVTIDWKPGGDIDVDI